MDRRVAWCHRNAKILEIHSNRNHLEIHVDFLEQSEWRTSPFSSGQIIESGTTSSFPAVATSLHHQLGTQLFAARKQAMNTSANWREVGGDKQYSSSIHGTADGEKSWSENSFPR